MTYWLAWLILVHLMAALGLFLTACIAGRVIRNGNDAPEPVEHVPADHVETTIFSPPSYHMRVVDK